VQSEIAVEEEKVGDDLLITQRKGVIPYGSAIDEVEGTCSVGAQQTHARVVSTQQSQAV
jgi:hypothetical protein